MTTFQCVMPVVYMPISFADRHFSYKQQPFLFTFKQEGL